MMVLFASVCAVFAPNLMQWFSLSKEATEIGTLALRLQCICMPLLPLNFMCSLTYQVVGNKVAATLLAIARQGLFYLPAIWLLPLGLQLFGVQASQSVSDILSFLFSVPFTWIFFKDLKRRERETDEVLERAEKIETFGE